MIKDLGSVFDSLYKSRKHLVELSLEGYPKANNVYEVDDFCCWFPGAQPMKREGKTWKLTIPLYEGDYRYAFVVDGYKWLTDPDNQRKARNPYGMKCSFFMVGEELLTTFTTRNDGKIQLNGLYHDQTPRYLDLEQNYAFFRFRTKKNDVNTVALVLKGLKESEKEFEMEKSWEDKYFDYYERLIRIAKYPLKYFFKIEDANITAYFSSSGSSYTKDTVADFALDEECMSIFQVPQWAKGAVFYQIFPDRFYNGDRKNDPYKVARWGDKPTRHNFFGGDLKGIIEKLDYLEELGIDAIYLTPIFCSRSNHKYDIYNYFQVDPHFGDDHTLKNLVKEAHKRGIKIVLDAVFNHTSDQFWAFKDIVKNQQKSKYVSWYFVRKIPVQRRRLVKALLKLRLPLRLRLLLFKSPPYYETFAGVPFMPKVNLLNAEAAKYFMTVAEYWIREANIDGWRFDVAFGIPYEFWKKLRVRLKKLKPDLYLLGEFGDGNPDPSAWVGAEAFDAVMNYPLRSLILDFVVFEIMGVEEFHQKLTELMGRLPKKALHVMYNLLGSHDTPRILTLCKGDVKKAKLAMLLQMTLPGAPAIYYGDEVGILGENDPDCRRTMPWNREEWNLELLDYYKQLIKIRKKEPAFAKGDLRVILKDEGKQIYVFERSHEEHSAIVGVNNSLNKVSFRLEGNKPLLQVFSDKLLKPQNDVIKIDISPKEGIILIKS